MIVILPGHRIAVHNIWDFTGYFPVSQSVILKRKPAVIYTSTFS